MRGAVACLSRVSGLGFSDTRVDFLSFVLGRCGGFGLGLVSGLGFSDTRVDFLLFVLGLVWFVGLGWVGLGWVGRAKKERGGLKPDLGLESGRRVTFKSDKPSPQPRRRRWCAKSRFFNLGR